METTIEKEEIATEAAPLSEAEQDKLLLLAGSSEKTAEVPASSADTRAWGIEGDVD